MVTAFQAIAETQADYGDLAGAQATAQNIGELAVQQSTMLNVAAQSARRTPIGAARQQLEKMLSPEEKIRFILALSEKYFPKRRHLATLSTRS